MDVIAKARELGAALQQDERYTKLMAAQKANEEDNALNELIARIQLVQMSFQHEAASDDAGLPLYLYTCSSLFSSFLLLIDASALPRATLLAGL